MADESTSTPDAPVADTPASEPTTAADAAALGDPGKAALDQERKARRDAEKAAKDFQKQLQSILDAGKSEDEKRAEALSALTKERDSALLELARHRAAVTHGLEPEDLEFLTGTPDEIEERASKLAARLGRAGRPASSKPKADPTQGAGGSAALDADASALGVLGF